MISLRLKTNTVRTGAIVRWLSGLNYLKYAFFSVFFSSCDKSTVYNTAGFTGKFRSLRSPFGSVMGKSQIKSHSKISNLLHWRFKSSSQISNLESNLTRKS